MKTLFGYLTFMTAVALLAAGCSKKGTVTSDGGSTSPNSGALGITKVYPTTSGESWTPIVASSRYYVKGLQLTVKGTCARGMNAIKVDEGAGNYTEETTCPVNGIFYWSKTYLATAEEGNKTLTFTAYDINDTAIAGSAASVQVRVDATAPSSPVVLVPAATPYIYGGAVSGFAVSGTVDPDVVMVTATGAVTITPVAGAWTHNATLVPNIDNDFEYWAWDLAGNQSPVTPQRISWHPSTTIRYGGAYSGAITADVAGGSGFNIESSSLAEAATTADTAGGSGFGLLNGFNHVVNKVRAD